MEKQPSGSAAGVGIVVQEHIPPRLSEDGAQLLADVLAKRPSNAQDPIVEERSRHDTLTARANARRRGQDPLRDRSTPVIDVVDVGSSTLVDNDSVPQTRPTVLMFLMGGMGLGALIVGLAIVIVLSSALENTPAVEVAGAVEAPPDAPSSTAKSAVTPTSVIVPSEIEVTISDVDPQIDGVLSFVLELKSVATQDAISTDSFDVIVEQRNETMAITFVRFENSVLEVGSSASATVRAEGVIEGGLSAVVRLGVVEIARLPLV